MSLCDVEVQKSKDGGVSYDNDTNESTSGGEWLWVRIPKEYISISNCGKWLFTFRRRFILFICSIFDAFVFAC